MSAVFSVHSRKLRRAPVTRRTAAGTTTPVASMAEALKAQGNASFKEGRYDQAVGYFTSAIDLDGTNAVLFSNRSGAHASLGQFDKALSDADKAVPHLP